MKREISRGILIGRFHILMIDMRTDGIRTNKNEATHTNDNHTIERVEPTTGARYALQQHTLFPPTMPYMHAHIMQSYTITQPKAYHFA